MLMLIYICIFLVLVLDLIFSDMPCSTTLVVLIFKFVDLIMVYTRAYRTFLEAFITIAVIDVGVCVKAE